MMHIMLLQYSVISVNFHDWTNFVCVDDKQKIKVGEPGNPLAAAECDRRVLVHCGATFEVSDHDFSNFSSALYHQLPCLLTYLKIFLDMVSWSSQCDFKRRCI